MSRLSSDEVLRRFAPDGHELEFIAPLPEPPRPELGVVPWEEWKAKK